MHLLNAKDVLKLFLDQTGFKKQKHPSFTRFQGCFSQNTDFSLIHFTNFSFAQFEIQESFGLIWVKLQNG